MILSSYPVDSSPGLLLYLLWQPDLRQAPEWHSYIFICVLEQPSQPWPGKNAEFTPN